MNLRGLLLETPLHGDGMAPTARSETPPKDNETRAGSRWWALNTLAINRRGRPLDLRAMIAAHERWFAVTSARHGCSMTPVHHTVTLAGARSTLLSEARVARLRLSVPAEYLLGPGTD